MVNAELRVYIYSPRSISSIAQVSKSQLGKKSTKKERNQRENGGRGTSD
jgi:hypothetical protein